GPIWLLIGLLAAHIYSPVTRLQKQQCQTHTRCLRWPDSTQRGIDGDRTLSQSAPWKPDLTPYPCQPCQALTSSRENTDLWPDRFPTKQRMASCRAEAHPPEGWVALHLPADSCVHRCPTPQLYSYGRRIGAPQGGHHANITSKGHK
ncbi:mCG129512, isoform CRA_a, partial [Mus musculus]